MPYGCAIFLISAAWGFVPPPNSAEISRPITILAGLNTFKVKLAKRVCAPLSRLRDCGRVAAQQRGTHRRTPCGWRVRREGKVMANLNMWCGDCHDREADMDEYSIKSGGM